MISLFIDYYTIHNSIFNARYNRYLHTKCCDNKYIVHNKAVFILFLFLSLKNNLSVTLSQTNSNNC